MHKTSVKTTMKLVFIRPRLTTIPEWRWSCWMKITILLTKASTGGRDSCVIRTGISKSAISVAWFKSFVWKWNSLYWSWQVYVIYDFVRNDWSTRLNTSTLQLDVSCVCYKQMLNLNQMQQVLGFSLETITAQVLGISTTLIIILYVSSVCLIFYCKWI